MDVQDAFDVTGVYRTLSLSRDLSPRELEHAREYIRGYCSLGALPVFQQYEVKNVSPITGKNTIARRLANDTTYTGIVNYGALGSGTTAFSTLSTQLNTEVYRKAPSGTSSTNNIAYIDWYIATGDVANQTFQEFGAFIDGTASVNTGQAISLALTGGWVKSGALFVSLSMTLS